MAKLLYAAVGCFVGFIPTVLNAAPVVTMTETDNVVRTQVQGAGTYKVLDFYYSASAGAEFTNFRIIVTASTGFLFDPARLQDDRQQDDTSELVTAGSVDTYANTVMSAAAKNDGGYAATITAQTLSYFPSGSGAATPFTFLDWSVFDTVSGDDNDLNDFPASGGGPFAKTAPYRIARILATNHAGEGLVQVLAFDTQSAGLPTNFNFIYAVPEPATLSLLGMALSGGLCLIRRRRGA